MSKVVKNQPKSSSKTSWKTSKLSKPEAVVRIGTLFSGIGAAEHALKRLKVKSEIVFAGDIDPHVKASYFANYGITEDRWHDDVHAFNAKPYKGKVDIVVGGAPCQAFSMVGKRGGLADTRGTLFHEFARVIRECEPKVFIFENVRGLLSHDDGKTWKVIQKKFEKLGYSIHDEVLNSRDFGIPQNRQRLFVVGFKKTNTKFEFPKPIPLRLTMQELLEDSCDSQYYLKKKGVKFVTSSKNREKRYTQINGDIALCQKANQQFNWHGDFVYEQENNIVAMDFDEFIFDVSEVEEKYFLSTKVRKYVLASGTKTFKTSTETDLPVARPLLQSMHKMHRAGVDNYVTYPRGRIRKLTPRECLRLMGFRDSFKIVVSNTQMYRQTGNSIVVDVLVALFKQMDITKYGVKNARRR
jgi:DNA (cytosine-5)-methyltransferase 1